MGLFSFLNKRTSPWAFHGQETAPQSVRYALAHEKGLLGKEHIKDCAQGGYEHAAAYLLIKGVQSNVEVQKAVIEAFASRVVSAPQGEVKKTIKGFVLEAADELPDDVAVKGGKLGQYTRQGPSHWESLHTDAAQKAAKEDRQTFIVGHAMFLGLSEFIRAFDKAKKPFSILMPSMIEDEKNQYCGYVVRPGGRVTFLPKDFSREPAVIIDDTGNTGATENGIRNFWGGDSFEFRPLVRVTRS